MVAVGRVVSYDYPELPATKAALEKTVDMRIPLTFDTDDCKIIAEIIADEVAPFVMES